MFGARHDTDTCLYQLLTFLQIIITGCQYVAVSVLVRRGSISVMSGVYAS
jgi:hypothetical protein